MIEEVNTPVEEEVTPSDTEVTTQEKPPIDIASYYKSVREMLQTVEDHLGIAKDLIENEMIMRYDLKPSVIDEIFIHSKKELEELPIETIADLLFQHMVLFNSDPSNADTPLLNIYEHHWILGEIDKPDDFKKQWLWNTQKVGTTDMDITTCPIDKVNGILSETFPEWKNLEVVNLHNIPFTSRLLMAVIKDNSEEHPRMFGEYKTSIIEVLSAMFMEPEESPIDKEKKLSPMTEEEFRKNILSIRDSVAKFIKQKDDARKLKKESAEAFDEFYGEMNSRDSKKVLMDRLEEYKNDAKETTDLMERRKIERTIADIEKSMNMKFLYDRFEKVGDEKEAKMIVDTFFNNRKSEILMNKFRSKSKGFKIPAGSLDRFRDIETNFCDEKFHPFNNLFLFIFARMVAYGDPYNSSDKLRIYSLVSSLNNLVYHKFNVEETEKEFIDTIEDIETRFLPYVERFKTENVTWKGHERRKASDTTASEIFREKAIKDLNRWQPINTPVQVNYDECSDEELKNAVATRYHELVDQCVKEAEEAIGDIDDLNEDGTFEEVEDFRPLEEGESTPFDDSSKDLADTMSDIMNK